MDFIVYHNNDKSDWNQDPDACTQIGIRKSSRGIITGGPSVGKTNLVFNLINLSSPAYQKIYIYRNRNSREYDDIIHELITDIADMPKFDMEYKDKKILILFEDLDTLKPHELDVIDHIMRYSCSHVGMSCLIICQSYYSVPAKLRRKLDVFHLFLHSININHILMTVPLNKEEKIAINNFVKKNKKSKHDFLSIDFTCENKFQFNLKPVDIYSRGEVSENKKKNILIKL